MKETITTYVGNKPAKEIVEGVLNEFRKNPRDIILKARGRFISKAVDVLEILKMELNINNSYISTHTNDLVSKDGKQIKVSQITIKLNSEHPMVSYGESKNDSRESVPTKFGG